MKFNPLLHSLCFSHLIFYFQVVKHTEHENQKENEKEKEKIRVKIREEILSLIAHHVTAVNYIYRDTKFGEHRNIKFEVQRIKVCVRHKLVSMRHHACGLVTDLYFSI